MPANSSPLVTSRSFELCCPMRIHEAERLAATIMNHAGTHNPGSFDLMVFELRRLTSELCVHELVALELIAASGLSAPGTFALLMEQLRSRYPTDKDIDEFIVRIKRRVSLKTGKLIPHERFVRR